MQTLKPFLVLIFLVYTITAAAQDTTYFDKSWKQTIATNAAYFRTKTRNNDLWQVTDHFLTGAPQMTGVYTDDSFHIQQGEFSWYSDKGIITHQCTFQKGKEEGQESFYYPDGKLRVKGQNSNNKKTGEWRGYYQNGKLSGKAVYDTGRQVSGSFYNENGSRNKFVKEFERQAEYPGGPPQFLRFLNKTLRYPDSAVVHETEGIVIVDFKVSKEGKVENPHVSQSVDKYLDEEALRVMRLMQDWIPAIFGGVTSDDFKRQPVVFHLR
ncbi:TonB family protein [Puia sp. P3]|uniref:TonB family protein n=1 Tax=Puia sp. P3 TaxID=3423952 RepID=UPI003D676E00